jgi:predicted 3-demethylubiquinone-9 3-methyltransferase (glyoxalase superfamily)
MHRITPHLWFDQEAREAVSFYTQLFPSSRLESVNRLRNTPSGDCDLVRFTLAGQPFMAISAGPMFRFNPTISFLVQCQSGAEVDGLWGRLAEGGKPHLPLGAYPFSPRYGWVADRFGLSWQLLLGGSGDGQKITPVLVFTGAAAGQAEEATRFYATVFREAPPPAEGMLGGGESQARVLARYGESQAPERPGTVQFAALRLRGTEFAAMDSARDHGCTFNEAISFLIPCDTQVEIDYFWNRLAADPNAGQCGWLKDRFGVSWQVAPAMMQEMLCGDAQAVDRVTAAFLSMKKFDLAALRRAYEGR